MNKHSAFVVEVLTASGLVAAILIAQIDTVAGLLFLTCGGALWATSPELSSVDQGRRRRVELLSGIGAFLIVLAAGGYLMFLVLKFLKLNSGFARAPEHFAVAGLVLLWSAQALYRKLMANDMQTAPEVREGPLWRALGVIEKNGLHMGGLALIGIGLFLGRYAGKFYEVRKPAVWLCIAIVATGVVIVARPLLSRLFREPADTKDTIA